MWVTATFRLRTELPVPQGQRKDPALTPPSDLLRNRIRRSGERVQHGIKLVRCDQDLARLGALRRTDDPARLHQVHQSAGLREAHPELAPVSYTHLTLPPKRIV